MVAAMIRTKNEDLYHTEAVLGLQNELMVLVMNLIEMKCRLAEYMNFCHCPTCHVSLEWQIHHREKKCSANVNSKQFVANCKNVSRLYSKFGIFFFPVSSSTQFNIVV